MRLAIVSDVHGNLTALDAVIADIESRGVDLVVHGGDLALGGCQPAEVIDRVRELGWPGVVGNVDEMLWRPDRLGELQARSPQLGGMFRERFEETAPATLALIGDERLTWLRTLPAEWTSSARLALTVVHASPGDLWRAPAADADDADLIAAYGRCGSDVVVYGHIHVPFTRRVGELLVANSGSVGSPFDGDPRASYLLAEEAACRIVRVEYDIERELALLARSGYPGAAQIADARRRGRPVVPPGHRPPPG